MSRVLIAVHGYEPQGWAVEAARAVPSPDTSVVQVLLVLDVPAPPFTSLTPAARRRHHAAVAGWRLQAESRVQATVGALRAAMRRPPGVARVVCADGDPGRAVVEYARAWAAEVVVVGRDTRGRLARGLLGAAHERVVDGAPCAVLVTPAERAATPSIVPLGGWRLRRRRAALPGGA